MIPRLGRLGTATILLMPACIAHAQSAPDAPRERSGPAAHPPALPAWPRPQSLPGLTSPQVAPSTAQSSDGSGRVRQVVVRGAAVGAAAVPPRRWRAPDDGAGSFRLEHEIGQALDASWVERQFVLNGFSDGGSEVSKAIALVQLLNRAFATAGFINSGLLVPEQIRLGDGVLELQLVHGTLAAHGG